MPPSAGAAPAAARQGPRAAGSGDDAPRGAGGAAAAAGGHDAAAPGGAHTARGDGHGAAAGAAARPAPPAAGGWLWQSGPATPAPPPRGAAARALLRGAELLFWLGVAAAPPIFAALLGVLARYLEARVAEGEGWPRERGACRGARPLVHGRGKPPAGAGSSRTPGTPT
jgi:hypothetical protein